MASSKFANLPGFAHGEADVYESVGVGTGAGLASHSSTSLFSQLPVLNDINQSGEVERVNINASDSYTSFKGKILNVHGADFSDSISSSSGGRKHGYIGSANQWEADGGGMADESLQDRYERLQNDICSLEKDFQCMAREEERRDSFLPQIHTDFAQKIEFLKKRLSNTNPAQPADLPNRVEIGAGDGSSPACSQPELQQSGSSKEHNSCQTVAFEHRIRKLEQAFGSDKDLMAWSSGDSSNNLMATVTMLKNQMSLLDKDNLDEIERRMQSFLPRLNQAIDKHAQMANPDTDKQVLEAYALLKRWEETMKVLPSVVDRLVALKAVHQQAAELVQLQEETQQLQQELLGKVTIMEGNIKLSEEAFAQNMATIRKNMDHLENRVRGEKS